MDFLSLSPLNKLVSSIKIIHPLASDLRTVNRRRGGGVGGGENGQKCICLILFLRNAMYYLTLILRTVQMCNECCYQSASAPYRNCMLLWPRGLEARADYARNPPSLV